MQMLCSWSIQAGALLSIVSTIQTAPTTGKLSLCIDQLFSFNLLGGRRPDRIGLLDKPQHSYRQQPVAVVTSLHSSHPNAGLKQYECGHTQPLLCNVYEAAIKGKPAIET